MPIKLLLKLIPIKIILAYAWDQLEPMIIKKVQETPSNIDDKILKELSDLIKELLK